MAIAIQCIAVALLCLLAVAASASAECAWVMWVGTTENGVSSGWDPSEAFSSQVPCSAKVANRLRITENERYTAKAGGFVVVDQTVFYFKPGDGKQAASSSWTYRCLPDTVDPRGPKGK